MTAQFPVANSKVLSLVDRHVVSTNTTNNSTDRSNDDADPDALFAELEAEDDSAFRAARAQQLASELSKLRPNNNAAHPTAAETYTTLRSDDEVLRFTTNTDRCLLHFLHPEFARCAIMDSHLQRLAERQGQYNDDVKVGRVDVRDAGFVVEKLGVRVLPCVIGFVCGLAKGRIVGFEGVTFGEREDGMDVTKAIERMAIGWGIFERRLLVDTDGEGSGASDEEHEVRRKSGRRGIQGKRQAVDEDDEEWD
jgi:hypothetical protein